MHKDNGNIQFDNAMLQLEWLMAHNREVYRDKDDICFKYLKDYRCLTLKNNRLYLTPGTQMVLVGYDTINVSFEEDRLIISARKRQKWYRKVVYEP